MMMKEYDTGYVHGLEQRVKDLEQEIHVWEMNGVMLDVDVRAALFQRERDRERAAMDEEERRELERVDDILSEMGY